MSTSSGSRDHGRFVELAAEFAERYRRGERPNLQEYVDRLPQMADEIRAMFPVLVEVERVKGEARVKALLVVEDPAVPVPNLEITAAVRKHRGAVISATVVLLSLLAGIAGTTSGMIRAESRRKEAEAARVAEAKAREGEKREYDRSRTTITFAVTDLRHTLDSSIYTKTVQDEFGRQIMRFVDKISRADSDGINERGEVDADVTRGG